MKNFIFFVILTVLTFSNILLVYAIRKTDNERAVSHKFDELVVELPRAICFKKLIDEVDDKNEKLKITTLYTASIIKLFEIERSGSLYDFCMELKRNDIFDGFYSDVKFYWRMSFMN